MIGAKETFSLREILSSLWNNKWIVLFLCSMWAVVVFLCSFFINPLYEASASIMPPASSSSISKLNMYRAQSSALKPINVMDLYLNFRAFLISAGNKTSVIKKYPNLKINFIVIPPFNTVDISVRGRKPEEAMSALKQLITNARNNTLESVKRNVSIELSSLQTLIKNEKASLKINPDQFLVKRKILEDAYKMASEAKIETPVVNEASKSDFVSANSNYLRGTKALMVELNALRPNSIDYEKLAKIQLLQNEYDNNKNIIVDEKGMAFFQVPKNYPVLQEIYSRKKNFILFSFLFGVLFIMTFVVFKKGPIVKND
ncbi:Chain length determinant protein (plasmid) [Legionella adelaidensis]|uniref:Chain length determinant protein n=1 Tax=Legionella adelaidensis TaxID=45056 RepID=A0A0W0R4V0_9GAMM|nr:Wzz/FepE/Etk N-terminal domain-containing protein [Legionella adelaidensis]KTC66073.1 Chain length determinant protein [Legionella adelaidensis]VEH85709.1 Chain length determinant protein [Legionella adelaidensis]